ncbi:unnamed protein product, partial [Ascophyllum nodosum]
FYLAPLVRNSAIRLEGLDFPAIRSLESSRPSAVLPSNDFTGFQSVCVRGVSLPPSTGCSRLEPHRRLPSTPRGTGARPFGIRLGLLSLVILAMKAASSGRLGGHKMTRNISSSRPVLSPPAESLIRADSTSAPGRAEIGAERDKTSHSNGHRGSLKR